MHAFYRAEQIACPIPIGHAQVRKIFETRLIFRARTFYLVKNKKPLDLQVFSGIGKTVKKLQ